MRAILLFILFLSFTSASIGQTSIHCLPDSGVQTAKTFAKFEDDDIHNPYENQYQLVEYDTLGRLVLFQELREKSEHRRVYSNGKLQLFITKRKDLPNHFLAEDMDSLIENASEIIDTGVVVSHHPNGELAELALQNGGKQKFEYEGCSVETQITLTSNLDTVQVYKFFFENGVVVKTSWATFPSPDPVIRKYFDYEFNKHGHWIRRKYKISKGTVIEWRELTYY